MTSKHPIGLGLVLGLVLGFVTAVSLVHNRPAKETPITETTLTPWQQEQAAKLEPVTLTKDALTHAGWMLYYAGSSTGEEYATFQACNRVREEDLLMDPIVYDCRPEILSGATFQPLPGRGYAQWGLFHLNRGLMDHPGPPSADGARFLANETRKRAAEATDPAQADRWLGNAKIAERWVTQAEGRR